VCTDCVSAALDEHDLHTEGSICLHTERSRGVHRLCLSCARRA
jgi:hypothetical protein